MRGSFALPLLLLAVGCGGTSAPPPPTTGEIDVQFTAKPSTDARLAITGGRLGIDELDLFGDVSSNRAMAQGVEIDPTSTQVQSVMLTGLPQGIYSRLRVKPETVELQGTWRGTPLAIAFELDDQWTDLFAQGAPELTPGATLAFPVTIDEGAWFAGVDLDQATASGGQIQIDGTQNSAIMQSIANALLGSFTLTSTVP
jgi:hypothetical protein